MKLHSIHNIDNIGKVILGDLRNYHLNSKFKKNIMHIMINFLSQKDLHKIETFFHLIDTDNTGQVPVKELQLAFKETGNDIALEEIEYLIKEYGNDDHTIKYSNFLEAVAMSKMSISHEFLWNAFKYFDVDSDGFITFQDLDLIFARTANSISKDDLTNILKELGKGINDKIDFETFKEIMTKNEINKCQN